MKKLRLSSEYNYDFQLYGIISEVKEYTLSWAINFHSSIELEKKKDLIIDIKDVGEIPVSNYQYETETLNIHLIKNILEKNSNSGQKMFVPSMSNFNYILKIEIEDDQSFLNEFLMSLRKSDKIGSILKLDVNKIKEKEYFLF